MQPEIPVGRRPAPLPVADNNVAVPTRVTLVAPSRAGLERLATLLDKQVGLRAGPRLLATAEHGGAPPLVTPLALCELAGMPARELVDLLGDPAIRRQRPYLVVLVDAEDALTQRLVLAASPLVGAVAARGVEHDLVGAALRLLAGPLAAGTQLWFGELRPPSERSLPRGYADLALLRMLLRSGKLAETAAQVGYTRRGVQAQLAALSQSLELRQPCGRRSTQAIADSLLAALGRPASRLALAS